MLGLARGNSKSLRREVQIVRLMENISPSSEVLLSLVNETISPLGKLLDLSGRNFINPFDTNLN